MYVWPFVLLYKVSVHFACQFFDWVFYLGSLIFFGSLYIVDISPRSRKSCSPFLYPVMLLPSGACFFGCAALYLGVIPFVDSQCFSRAAGAPAGKSLPPPVTSRVSPVVSPGRLSVLF